MQRRIVVKLGTSVLTGGTQRLNRPNMVELARQCATLRQKGHDVIVCTSGAIAAGREALDFPDLAPTITNKQVLAAVGQSRLMQLWGSLFEIYDIAVGQILLTRADVESRQRYLNAQDTLNGLLEQGIVPIVNENDAVAIEEIKVGDNDNLSALVAVLSQADLLLLLTDQDGLYTTDPRVDPSAQLIAEVPEITDEIRKVAGGSVSGLGVGGMATKLESAEIATRAGTDVIIAAGHTENIILRLAANEPLGTRFCAQPDQLVNRKKWLLAGSKPAGTIMVDGGAVKALQRNATSLLPAGVVGIQGSFERGDTVAIAGQNQQPIARGIARYSSQSLAKIHGCQSSEIEERLGYTYGKVAVHRDDMILL